MSNDDAWLRELLEVHDQLPSPPIASLDLLGRNIEEYQRLQGEIKYLEDKLSASKEALRILSENDIPEIFSQLGMAKYTLDSGQVVEITDFVSGQVKSPLFFDWCENNDLGEIVKVSASFTVRRTAKKSLQPIVDMAAAMDCDIALKEAIHPQTLAATLREMIRQGTTLPPAELVECYVGRKTKIK